MNGETETEADERLGMGPSASPVTPRQSQVTAVAPIPDQIGMDIQTSIISSSSVVSVTAKGTSHILTLVQYDETLRSQVLRIYNEVKMYFFQIIAAFFSPFGYFCLLEFRNNHAVV